MPALAIQLLGGLQVSRDDVPVRGLYGHVRALLACICAEQDRPVSRRTLAELLWPDDSEQAARRNLRQALSRLRIVIGDQEAREPLILVGGGVVQLNPRSAHVVDLHEFLAAARCGDRPDSAELPWLEAAAARYRGPFLEQFDLADNPVFDQWVLTKREAYARRALGYLRALAGYYQGAGDLERAALYVRRQIEIEPWLESAHRHLMGLLAQSGQRGAALAQFRVCESVLWDELGVEPDATTVALHEQISRGEDLTAQRSDPLAPAPMAERRQVTVLCCGVGLPDADPEPLLELDDWLAARCAELAHELQAHYHNDGMGLHRLLFGYPLAQGDEARRAVLAALTLRDAAGALAQGDLHVGVESGIAVVPDPRRVLAGATMNSALGLRLQAPANEVLLGAQIARQVEGEFELDPCQALRAWRVRGRGADGRARRGSFCGRVRELRLLHQAWERASAGRAGCVLVSGAPGMGKSRLIQMLRRKLAHQAPVLYGLRCQPRYPSGTARPVTELLAQLSGQRPDDAPELRRRRLETLLAGLGAEGEGELLEALLGEGELDAAARDASWLRRAIGYLAEALRAAAAREATLLLVEDVHWADPLTLELLRRLLDGPRDERLLIVLTSRPEDQPAERLGGEVNEIRLSPLSGSEARRLVRALAPGRRLQASVVDEIVARTDGVPLFVQELTIAVLDQEDEGSLRGLPATLRDVLAARLDGVGPAKRLAQAAAVIGREFDLSTLAALDGRDRARVQADLSDLLRAGIVQALAQAGDSYAFSHALFQEAAHDSLLQRHRLELHAKLVDLLPPGPEAAVLRAQHLTLAERWAQAIRAWAEAGRRAHRLAMHADAVAHFRAGLALLERVGCAEERDALELELRVGIGMPLMFLHGPVPEMEQALARALELTRRLPEHHELFEPVRGLYTYYLGRADFAAAAELAEQMLRIGRAQRCEAIMLEAFRAQGMVLLLRGEVDAAARRFQHVLMLQESADPSELIGRLGLHPGPIAAALLAGAEAVAGFVDDGRDRALAAVEAARHHGHSVTLGIVLNLSLSVVEAAGELDALDGLAAELEALAEHQQMPVWRLWARISRSRVALLGGGSEVDLPALLALLERYDRAGPEMGRPYALLVWAETCLLAGAPERGLPLVQEALERARAQGALLNVPDLHRVHGDLLLACGNREGAAAAWRAGVALAARCGTARYERQCRERLANLRACALRP